MLDAAQGATERIAQEEGVSVEWERLWRIEPIPFDDELIDARRGGRARGRRASRTGCRAAPCTTRPRWRRLMPTVMLFVKSLRGLSHTKDEDTPEEDLELSVRALHRLAVKTMEWAEG